MTSNKSYENLELLAGEEVLYETSAKIKNYGKMVFFLLLGVGSVFGIGIGSFLPNVPNIIFIIIPFPIICGALGILIWDGFNKEEESCYYITTKRIIKIYGHGFLPYKFKHKKLFFNDIAHFHDCEDLIEIITRGSNGELHYNGEEVEYIEQTPKIAKKIQLFFENKEDSKKQTEIIELLRKLIPAKKHPNLEYAYMNSNQ